MEKKVVSNILEEVLEELRSIECIANELSEELTFDSKSHFGLKKTNKLKHMLSNLRKKLINNIDDIEEVVMLEEVIVKPGEVKRIKTNIDNIIIDSDDHFLDFSIEGILPLNGNLMFSLEQEKIDNSNNVRHYIVVNNILANEIYEQYDLAGYHYCKATNSRVFTPGIYLIDEGQSIGIVIRREKQKVKIMK
jgi:hypothetical protein